MVFDDENMYYLIKMGGIVEDDCFNVTISWQDFEIKIKIKNYYLKIAVI